MSITVSSVIPRNQYTASASQTTFVYPWPIITNEDLLVYRTPVGSDPSNLQLLVLNAEYTVTGAGTDDGGNVVLIDPATAGDIITIQRSIALERTNTYTNGQAIEASSLNDDFNKLTMSLQDQNAYLQRIIAMYPVPTLIPAASRALPTLPQGYMWLGGPNDSITAVVLSENPDASTLASQLANAQSGGAAGAYLVGYYSSTDGSTTVGDELDKLSTSINTHVLSILDFGGNNQGSADNASALNAAYSYMAANDIGSLRFPAGTYLFETQPNAAQSQVKIVGDGASLTSVIRSYTPTTAFRGLFRAIDMGISVIGMTIAPGDSTNTGSAIEVTTASDLENCVHFDDIVTDSADGIATLNYGIYINGSGTGTIYNPVINNCNMSSCDIASVYAFSVDGATFDVASSAGISSTDKIIITGDASDVSTKNTINIGSVTDLQLDWITNSVIKAATITNVTNTSNCSGITVYGRISGTKQTNWTTSRYICNEDFLGVVADEGYQKLPNGLIMQWCSISVTDVFSDVALPVTFPNEIFGIFGSAYTSSTGNDEILVNDNALNTTSTVHVKFTGTAAPGTVDFNILVLGR